jgi:uridine kinase
MCRLNVIFSLNTDPFSDQNADSDLMLARRIRRDIAERGRDVEGVLTQYLRFVKNSYDNFVFPSSKFADIVSGKHGSRTAGHRTYN